MTFPSSSLRVFALSSPAKVVLLREQEQKVVFHARKKGDKIQTMAPNDANKAMIRRTPINQPNCCFLMLQVQT